MGIISKVIVNSVVAIVACLLVGIAFHGWSVFNPQSAAFEFVLFGSLGSLFFFSLKANRRQSFAVLLVLFFIQSSLITKSYFSVYLLRDAVFFLAVSGATYLFFIYFHRPALRDKWLEPLILAVVFALSFFIALVALHVFRGIFLSLEQLRFVIIPVMENGFLIGLGIGLGIVLVEIDLLQWLRTRIKALFS
ncbi:MAG TPA: hypothetical protein VI758_10910 [Bacteroidota bacterium]